MYDELIEYKYVQLISSITSMVFMDRPFHQIFPFESRKTLEQVPLWLSLQMGLDVQ